MSAKINLTVAEIYDLACFSGFTIYHGERQLSRNHLQLAPGGFFMSKTSCILLKL